MRRDQLEHLIRAASRIVGERDVLIIGSQSVLASFGDVGLPMEVTRSIEADLAFFEDPADEKADQVDGAIGELSPFHEMYGYYAQGVSVTTATLPRGWRDRLVLLDTPATEPGRGLCLEPHDCVVSKLVAGRVKDIEFAGAMIEVGLVEPAILVQRTQALGDVPAPVRHRILEWLRRR